MILEHLLMTAAEAAHLDLPIDHILEGGALREDLAEMLSDTLTLFIIRELYETYDANLTTDEQVAVAVGQLEQAVFDLKDAQNALERVRATGGEVTCDHAEDEGRKQ